MSQFAKAVVSETDKTGVASARSMRRQTCSWKRGGSDASGFHSFNSPRSEASFSLELLVFIGFNFVERRADRRSSYYRMQICPHAHFSGATWNSLARSSRKAVS